MATNGVWTPGRIVATVWGTPRVTWAMIEDKNSGTILLQQARRMRAEAIESKLTAMGKVERALSDSGYVYRGNVKYTHYVFNKTTVYKRKSRNHPRRPD